MERGGEQEGDLLSLWLLGMERKLPGYEVEEDDGEDDAEVSFDKQYSEQEEFGSQPNGEGCRCTEDDR